MSAEEIERLRGLCEKSLPKDLCHEISRDGSFYEIAPWDDETGDVDWDREILTTARADDDLAECVCAVLNAAPALLDEVGRLQTDLALNAQMLARQCDLAREAETRELQAKREVEKLRGALEFYADRENWRVFCEYGQDPLSGAPRCTSHYVPTGQDRGAKARAALGVE